MNDEKIDLTLVGKCNENVKDFFLRKAGPMAGNLIFYGTVTPDEILTISATMDIGLALEQHTPYNRDICLTNKIFTYLQAGNAIILTNTQAQTQFQQEYKVGYLCGANDVDNICNILKEYKNNIGLLNQQKESNWKLANELLNWENESKKLLAIIK